VAGKTGTARKSLEGQQGYAGTYVASFAGFVPATDPAFTAMVVLDQPSPIYGGLVAAPVFRAISTYALRELAVPPPPPDPGLFAGVPHAQPSAATAADEPGKTGGFTSIGAVATGPGLVDPPPAAVAPPPTAVAPPTTVAPPAPKSAPPPAPTSAPPPAPTTTAAPARVRATPPTTSLLDPIPPPPTTSPTPPPTPTPAPPPTPTPAPPPTPTPPPAARPPTPTTVHAASAADPRVAGSVGAPNGGASSPSSSP
jgi:hypothetical protein